MVLPRASAFRTVLRSSVTRTPRTAAGARSWGQIGRRGYASHGHDAKKSGSDLPWLIGSVAVTVPGTYWLLQQGTDTSHGHGSHSAKHGENHEEKEEEEGDEPEGKDDGSDSESDDGSKQDTPDTSEDEGPEGEKTDSKESGQSTLQDVNGSAVDEAEDKDTAAKQEGLSNIGMKHNTDVASNPEKSKKSEGAPETSKPKGSADPKRPQK